MREIYRPLYLLETPIVFTSIRTAELIKYASNAFLAVKISFINEIVRSVREDRRQCERGRQGAGARTRGSARSSFTPESATADRAFPRMSRRSFRTAGDAGRDLAGDRAPRAMSTSRGSTGCSRSWRERSRTCRARRSRCWAYRSNQIQTI